MKQLKLFNESISKEFGGSLLKGKRKKKRPIDTRKPMHLVFKAKNPDKLLREVKPVRQMICKYANQVRLKIFSIAVHADHIHICLRVDDRTSYVKWVRALTSRLVQLLPGLKWALRPYTRIMEWGRDLKRVISYLTKNRNEARIIVDGHS